MNKSKKTFYLFNAVAFCGVIFGLIHLLNKILFRLSGRKALLDNIWRSEYGDIAFRKQGVGEPLLLVHSFGIGAGSNEWEGCIEALSESHTVYTIELPGYGSSSKPCASYNSYYYTRVINDFIRCVIGRGVAVAALWDACGPVLAGAAMESVLYRRIIAINPYEEGLGADYRSCLFVRKAIQLPVIGTLVYNFISSRQSILSHLEALSDNELDYADVYKAMEKRYKNAHLFGEGNKYAVMSLIRGYFKTPVFQLMERCAVPLNVVVSEGSPLPMLDETETLTISQIKTTRLLPCFSDTEEFSEIILGFLSDWAQTSQQ